MDHRSRRPASRLAVLACAVVATVSVALAGEPTAANAFAFDLLARLRGVEGNLFVSPASVRTALAMTTLGARGETAEQLVRALRLDAADPDQTALATGRRALEDAAGDDAVWVAANRLWVERTHPLLPAFVDAVAAAHEGGVEQVGFRGDAEAARGTINAWVADVTRDRIADLLAPGAVNPDTRLTLVNAVYFRGLWANPFDESRTRDEPFYRADGSSVPVPLMTHGSPPRLRHAASEGLQAVEFPYRGGGFSLVVVLPDAPDGLPAIERSLDATGLEDLLGAMRTRRVEAYLPRFELTWGTADLVPALQHLGIHDLFLDGVADLSGIDGGRELFVGGVFHQAFVAVDEEGTEAAAATAVVVGITSALPEEAVVFRADRPFLFLIRAQVTGEVLFLGRLVDPSAP